MLALALAGGLLLLGALVPSPVRVGVRVALLWIGVLVPVIAVGVWIAGGEHAGPAAWLALIPLTLLYLSALDLWLGVSARLAPPPAPPHAPRLREADEGERDPEDGRASK